MKFILDIDLTGSKIKVPAHTPATKTIEMNIDKDSYNMSINRMFHRCSEVLESSEATESCVLVKSSIHGLSKVNIYVKRVYHDFGADILPCVKLPTDLKIMFAICHDKFHTPRKMFIYFEGWRSYTPLLLSSYIFPNLYDPEVFVQSHEHIYTYLDSMHANYQCILYSKDDFEEAYDISWWDSQENFWLGQRGDLLTIFIKEAISYISSNAIEWEENIAEESFLKSIVINDRTKSHYPKVLLALIEDDRISMDLVNNYHHTNRITNKWLDMIKVN